jgi:cobalt/nickel transport protein
MKRHNLLLLAAVIAVALIPLLLPVTREGREPFTGVDSQAETLITTLHPEYKRWVTPWWEPPSAEIESLLWAVEAGLGSGLLGYYIGFKRGQAQSRRRDGADAAD